MMHAQPRKEHEWLQRLVGEWTFESEASMGPDQPPMKAKGSERVRPLGGLWILGEGQGECPGVGPASMLLTVGYDPAKGKFVGSWVGSMMTNQWIYEGSLDASGRVLTLNTEGPDMTQEGKTANYREMIEIKSDDRRLWTSQVQGADGSWQTIMTADYRRKK